LKKYQKYGKRQFPSERKEFVVQINRAFSGAAVFFSLFVLVQVRVNADAYHDTLPQWLIPLRDAVYEQSLGVNGAYPLFEMALAEAEKLSGADKFNMRSRCEYLIARVYQYNKNKDKALEFYQKGYDDAKRALDEQKTAAGWTNLGINLSQLCTLKSTVWVMAHGLDVEKNAKNALALDPRNAKARFLVAARWVYAPKPFYDLDKGVTMMKDMLEGAYDLERDDLFNVYSAIAYAYIQAKNKNAAREWLDKSLTVFPTNKYAGEELKGQL
jgi:tetratricopeptide (TPR) repeat protein